MKKLILFLLLISFAKVSIGQVGAGSMIIDLKYLPKTVKVIPNEAELIKYDKLVNDTIIVDTILVFHSGDRYIKNIIGYYKKNNGTMERFIKRNDNDSVEVYEKNDGSIIEIHESVEGKILEVKHKKNGKYKEKHKKNKGKVKGKQKNIHYLTFQSSVNNLLFPDRYHISHLEYEQKDMYIYWYTGSKSQGQDSIYYSSGMITNVLYEGLKFNEGTYVINLFDENSFLGQKIMNKEDVSEYCQFSSSRYKSELLIHLQLDLLITNKGVLVNKVSDKGISPKDIEGYLKNLRLERPKVVKQILSVFEEK